MKTSDTPPKLKIAANNIKKSGKKPHSVIPNKNNPRRILNPPVVWFVAILFIIVKLNKMIYENNKMCM